jgi:hypothetical protein
LFWLRDRPARPDILTLAAKLLKSDRQGTEIPALFKLTHYPSLAVPAPRAALRGFLRSGGRYDQAPSHGSTSPFHHSQILQIRRMSKIKLYESSNGQIYI